MTQNDPKLMSTNRDQTSANDKSDAFLTIFVWAPRSEHAFLSVILVPTDGFETFFGAHNGVYGAILNGWRSMYGGHLGPTVGVNHSGRTVNGVLLAPFG